MKIENERAFWAYTGMRLVSLLGWALHSYRALNLKFLYYPQLRLHTQSHVFLSLLQTLTYKIYCKLFPLRFGFFFFLFHILGA